VVSHEHQFLLLVGYFGTRTLELAFYQCSLLLPLTDMKISVLLAGQKFRRPPTSTYSVIRVCVCVCVRVCVRVCVFAIDKQRHRLEILRHTKLLGGFCGQLAISYYCLANMYTTTTTWRTDCEQKLNNRLSS